MVLNDGIVVEVMGKKYRFDDYEDLEWTLKDFKAEWGTYLDDAPPRSKAMINNLQAVVDLRDIIYD